MSGFRGLVVDMPESEAKPHGSIAALGLPQASM
jgi:hypothetical protein